MKTTRWFIAAALLASAGACVHTTGRSLEKNEARLARMLEGRTAGDPVSCIAMPKGNRLEVIDEVAMVYTDGDTLYVARPTDPEMLGRDDVLVIDRYSSQLCHTDVVRTVDRAGGYFTGVVFLGKFVPYKKQ